MPGVGLDGFQLAPAVMMPAISGDKSGLLQFGARLRYRCLIQLPPQADADAVVQQLQQQWQLPDWSRRQYAGEPGAELRIRSYQDQEEQLQQAYDQLDRFLGLLAVFMALLASIGVATMTRALIMGQREALGLLPVLGAEVPRLVRIFVIQILVMSVMAALIGFGLGEWAVLGLLGMAADYVPVDLEWSWSTLSLVLALVIGPGLALIGGSSSLVALVGFKPLPILRGDDLPRLGQWRLGLVALAMFLTAWGLSWWQSGSLVLASILVGSLLLIALLILGCGRLLLLLMGQVVAKMHPRWALVARQWRRRPDQRALLVAIGLPVVLLTALITHRGSLLHELDQPPALDAPNLFAINITEAQREPVAQWIAERPQLSADYAPLVRARLTAINGEALIPITDRIDDPELLRQERMRHREQRLSWQNEPGPDEKIIQGSWLDAQAPMEQPELSIEREFAETVGIVLGDTITLSVQGLPIEVPVTSVREVDWRNARPNFFMLLTPSALDGAPQEWIAAIKAPHDQRQEIQAEMSREFVAVSVLDIGELLQRVRVMLAAVLSTIAWLAGLGLAVGLLVLAALLLVSMRQRRADAALMRVLGHNRPTTWQVQAAELAGQLSAASLPAVIITVALMAWVLPAFFKLPAIVPWAAIVLLLAAILLLALAIAAWLVWPLRRQGVADSLREP